MNKLEMKLAIQAMFLASNLTGLAQNGSKRLVFLAGRAWDRYVRRIKKFNLELSIPPTYPPQGYYHKYGSKLYGTKPWGKEQ